MRPDPFETIMNMVQISIAFIWDLADPLCIGSPIRYQMSSFAKMIQIGTVPSHCGTETVSTQHHSGKLSQSGFNPNETKTLLSCVNAALVKSFGQYFGCKINFNCSVVFMACTLLILGSILTKEILIGIYSSRCHLIL